jgi:hypothetical protein
LLCRAAAAVPRSCARSCALLLLAVALAGVPPQLQLTVVAPRGCVPRTVCSQLSLAAPRSSSRMLCLAAVAHGCDSQVVPRRLCLAGFASQVVPRRLCSAKLFVSFFQQDTQTFESSLLSYVVPHGAACSSRSAQALFVTVFNMHAKPS